MSGSVNAGVQPAPTSQPAQLGGMQPMQMLQAYRSGTPISQLGAMNPVAMRPAQFLPPSLPQFNYAAYKQQQADKLAAARQAAPDGWSGGPGF